ncbi:MAG: hypothetical protein HKM93_22925 [Desulfobacteraceae bacterium]|nr:hypothetical protein [Desulfobacteraceae bacterium]
MTSSNTTCAPSTRLTATGSRIRLFVALSVMLLWVFNGPAWGETDPETVELKAVRAGHHGHYTSVVFEFDRTATFIPPALTDDTLTIAFNNVRTGLSPYRQYKDVGTWVRLNTEKSTITARIGLTEHFNRFTYFVLQYPDRVVVNLYDNPLPVSSPPTAQPPESTPAAKGAGSTPDQAATSPPPKKAPSSGPEHRRLTLNINQGDIREILSALAIQQEMNIVMAPEVSGKVTIHLHQVDLMDALHAINRAAGFEVKRRGNIYYVFKPAEQQDPQSDKYHMRIFKLEYAEVTQIQEILEAIPGIRLIKIHEPSKTIIVEDTWANLKKIETLIGYWDVKPKQVLIEAKILEIALTDDMSFGVNWEKVLKDFRIGTGGFSTATLPGAEGVSPLPATGSGVFGNVITGAGTSSQIAAAIDALQSKTRIETLSTPRILAIHGKNALVQVGGKQGYRVTTTNVGVATETIEFIDTGTILELTPYIDDEGNTLLNIKPSINAARLEEGVPVVNSTVVSTWLMAKNGETVFIGGLIQDAGTETRDQVPCVGDIPGLGLLFGRRTYGSGKSELVVLITPHIVDGPTIAGEKAIETTEKLEERFKKKGNFDDLE